MGLGFALLSAHPGFAQTSGTAQTPAPIQFTVINSKTVQEGNHTVTYNRVAPLPSSAVFPATANGSATSAVNQGSQALQQLQAQQQHTLVSLLLSATVFNHQVTQFSWNYNGVTYQGYSNIDLTLFAGDTEFSVGNTTYSFLINATGVGANPITGAPVAVPSIPELPALTATQSAYVVVTTNGVTIPDEAVAPIEALHDYFDANRSAIAAAAAQRQADAAAQAQWVKDHPPVPQNTVINFWPIKSTVYGNAPQ